MADLETCSDGYASLWSDVVPAEVKILQILIGSCTERQVIMSHTKNVKGELTPRGYNTYIYIYIVQTTLLFSESTFSV